jgi:hypothetical protein
VEDRAKEKHMHKNKHVYKLRCRTCLQQWNYSTGLQEREKRKENDGASVILHSIRCDGGGYKDVY